MLGLHFNTYRLASDNSSNTRQAESLPTDDWVKEMWHIHARKHESALLKKGRIWSQTWWLKPVIPTTSEV